MTFVLAGVAFAAVSTLAYLLMTRQSSDMSALSRVIAPYLDGPDPSTPKHRVTKEERLEPLRAAFKAVPSLAPVLEWTEARLDQANVALRPPEALTIYALMILVGGGFAVLVAGPFVGLLFALGLALVPPMALRMRADKRLATFNTQLPETLILTASSLKAGYSFLQGIDTVAQEVKDPMAAELRRVSIEAQLGRPIEEALEECGERMQSPDFQWAVQAVTIQREVGGNLAELLETVADTMVERDRLRRDVKALTAEGRMSAILLGVLPLAIGGVLYGINPGYMNVLFQHTGGEIALGGGVVAMLVGFVWMKKIVDVKP